MTKTLNSQWVRFGHFVIRYSNLFRISSFDIRILPEHDFSFRHYLPMKEIIRGKQLWNSAKTA